METQATPKSRLQSLRLDDAVYAQLVELDERLKPTRGGKQVSALFCRAVELGLDFADELHASSHLQSTDHKQTSVRIPPALLARVLAVGEQITMRTTVVMRSAARRGLPLLTAEVELELTAPAELEAAS